MADRYWVGGTGNWSDYLNHWSASSGGAPGASKPTSADNVHFDASSFLADGQTVTLNESAYCLGMDWTGVLHSPTLAGSQNLYVYGSLTLIAAMLVTLTGTTVMRSGVSGNTVTTAAHTLTAMSFSSTGEWTLQDELTVSGGISLIDGSLITNGKAVSATGISMYPGGSTALDLGSSMVTLAASAGSKTFDIGTGMGSLYLDAGTSLVRLTGEGGVLNMRGMTLHDVECAGSATVSTATTVAALSVSSGKTLTLPAGATVTASTLSLDGAVLQSSSAGSTATLSCAAGAITMTGGSLRDIAAAGGATFTAEDCTNLGGNSGWVWNNHWTVSDTGSGADATAITVTLSAVDTGSGADATAIAVAIGTADGVFTTQAAVGGGDCYDPALDTGVGTDAAVVAATPSAIADTGAGADSASVRATLATLAETGLGADGVSTLVTMLLADTGHGVDAVVVRATLATLADSGAGADAVGMNASAAIADTGAGVDAILGLLALHVYVRSDGRVDPLGVILLRGGREDIMPSLREYTEDVPGRTGSVDFGSDLGARGLELRVASAGDLTPAQKTTLKRYVAGWLRPALGVFNIAWEDDPDRYLEVRIAGNIQPEEYANYLEFTIPLKATQPMYLGSTLQTLTGSGTAACAGNTETPATVTITGPVTNPSVTVAGASFTWTGTVGDGDALVVDGERRAVAFNTANALSGFSGAFPALQPGDNTITAASAGTTTTTWRDRWI